MKFIPLVICGGHLAPALAVVERLKEEKKYALHYFGRKRAFEGDKAFSLEFITVRRAKIPFYPLTTGRLQRGFTLYTLPSLVKLPLGLVQSFYYLLKIKPKLVVSFGGYVALPVALAAWFLKIPLITHEQTSILGLANQVIGRMAKVVCLSWPETKNLPLGVKTVLTGLPVRKTIFSPKKKTNIFFKDINLPLLYITGGSGGARSINKIVAGVIPSLIKKYRILHQSGMTDQDKDFRQLLKLKNSLPRKVRKNYQVVQFLKPWQVGEVLSAASLAVARAGANTVAEIAVRAVPAILIPLPWAGASEQEKNAQLLEKVGLVKIIKQEEFTPQRLLRTIESMLTKKGDKKRIKKEAQRLYSPKSSERIIEVIKSVLKE